MRLLNKTGDVRYLAHSGHAEKRNQCRYWGAKRDMGWRSANVCFSPKARPSADAGRRSLNGHGCAETAGSIRLDARELHHLAPFRGFFADQFAEIGRRA